MTLTSDAHISQIHRPLLIGKFLTGPTEASPGFEGFYPGPCFRLQHKRYIIAILHIIYRHFTYNICIFFFTPSPLKRLAAAKLLNSRSLERPPDQEKA